MKQANIGLFLLCVGIEGYAMVTLNSYINNLGYPVLLLITYSDRLAIDKQTDESVSEYVFSSTISHQD